MSDEVYLTQEGGELNNETRQGKMVDLNSASKQKDLSALADKAESDFLNRVNAQPQSSSPPQTGGNPVVAMTAAQFATAKFPPKTAILDPVLREKDLFEIYATRGVGKTLFTLQLAVSIASGSPFLKWQAVSGPRRVLYTDGEMPASLLQYRLKKALEWGDISLDQVDGNLAIITPDIQNGFMKNLSTPEGREWFLPVAMQADVIFIDSLLTLAPFGKSNDAESFMPMQEMLLQLRQAGKTVGFVHHAGKNGQQLGTINKETVLDTVFSLKRQVAVTGGENSTNMILEFTKNRSFYGKDAEALYLSVSDSGWKYQDAPEMLDLLVLKMFDETDLPQAAIAEELGVSQATVSRILKKHGKTRRGRGKE